MMKPATDSLIVQVASATEADVNAAVTSARAQFEGSEWSKMNGPERARLLHKLADLIERDSAILAQLEALDVGRPLIEPQMLDVPMTIDTIRYFAGWADKIEGRTIPTPDAFGRPISQHGAFLPFSLLG